MTDCIFCKIADGEIKSEIVYEDDKVIAFKDINPGAPVHFLIIPKLHIASLNDVNVTNAHYIAHIFNIIPKIAEEYDFLESGYRVVSNCGEDAMQTVEHIHFHVYAKRKLSWTPG